MKAISKSLFTILAVLALSIGVTSAYFTDQQVADGQVYTTGSLDISLAQSELFEPVISPGEKISTEFTLENTGTLPTHIKGYFDARWSDQQLSTESISFVDFEEFKDGVWSDVFSSPLQVAEEFDYQDGQGNNIALQPGELKTYRVSIALDGEAGNEYQDQALSSSLHFAAKQTTPGAEWPAEY